MTIYPRKKLEKKIYGSKIISVNNRLKIGDKNGNKEMWTRE